MISLDIETISADFESFSKEEVDYLFKFADSKEKEEEVKLKFPLWAPAAHLISLSLYIPDYKTSEHKGSVYYIAEDEKEYLEDIDGVRVKFNSFSLKNGIEEAEKKILQKFWELATHFKKSSYLPIVTFNGRSFDIPFLMFRSALLGVEVSENLLGSRFNHTRHVDLLEIVTFYGISRRYSLDFLLRRFGIRSSKEERKGDEIDESFRSGEYKEIAIYNMRDAIATATLYTKLKSTLGKAMGF